MDPVDVDRARALAYWARSAVNLLNQQRKIRFRECPGNADNAGVLVARLVTKTKFAIPDTAKQNGSVAVVAGSHCVHPLSSPSAKCHHCCVRDLGMLHQGCTRKAMTAIPASGSALLAASGSEYPVTQLSRPCRQLICRLYVTKTLLPSQLAPPRTDPASACSILVGCTEWRPHHVRHRGTSILITCRGGC